MNTGYVYLGEATGERVLRYGVGYVQAAAGGDVNPYFGYEFEAQSWGDQPFGNDGEGVIRWITAIVKHKNGYHFTLTPNLDDVDLQSQNFAGGAPSGGLTEQIVRCRAWVMRRANRVAFTLKTVELPGYFELVDVLYQYIPIRVGP